MITDDNLRFESNNYSLNNTNKYIKYNGSILFPINLHRLSNSFNTPSVGTKCLKRDLLVKGYWTNGKPVRNFDVIHNGNIIGYINPFFNKNDELKSELVCISHPEYSYVIRSEKSKVLTHNSKPVFEFMSNDIDLKSFSNHIGIYTVYNHKSLKNFCVTNNKFPIASYDYNQLDDKWKLFNDLELLR